MFRSTLTLLGLGAGLMYFYDPEKGERRRARFKAELEHALEAIDGSLMATVQDIQAHVHAIKGTVTGSDEPLVAPPPPAPDAESPATKLLVGTGAAAALYSIAGRGSPIRPLIALLAAGLTGRGIWLAKRKDEANRDAIYAATHAANGAAISPPYDAEYPETPVL